MNKKMKIILLGNKVTPQPFSKTNKGSQDNEKANEGKCLTVQTFCILLSKKERRINKLLFRKY